MIPENLREQWEKSQAKAEVLFLADHGGGYPDCLAGTRLTPDDRLAILRSLGFRVAEQYDMPNPQNWDDPVRWPWARLTNDVAVCLVDGIVNRAKRC